MANPDGPPGPDVQSCAESCLADGGDITQEEAAYLEAMTCADLETYLASI